MRGQQVVNSSRHQPLLKLLLRAVPLKGRLVQVASNKLLDVAITFAVGEGERQQKAVDLRCVWCGGSRWGG